MPSAEEERLQAERMRDVLLLLDNLIRREDVTIKAILSCLYDVGSANLINQKFRSRSLNGLMRRISTMSKPAFRFFAMRWIKKNCPELITKWLYSKASFRRSPTNAVKKLEAEVVDVKAVLLDAETRRQEVKLLRSQVKLLTGLLIGAITILGGSTLWLGYSQLPEAIPLIQSVRGDTQDPD
ncbi:hypothetical protein H6F88_28470 [Oculatella sp. FACHB-28]|uniref:hypothetical protein n=1 Tax=Cyanophyceae TaxID=3028117 RepID=UPI00168899EE|nr:MULTISPECIES: hypothetical protein [Cyanophyceae]MBD1869745.1 hypothetical protein [Cyanobacteria bacterium FACHB-471]MBD1999495.1 hypothetical protein [Leptolyngbya sp. FACHB-541]MBD2059877.1 hypothetical protein [Oculatella sp. FACHB-28]